MQIKPRLLPGVFEITLAPIRDERGFFMRAYDTGLFQAAGLHRGWVQENQSRSSRKGTIRGLHFQFPPYAETKLIHCLRGAVLDVMVDLRRGSATFGRWDAIELSESNHKAVLIPRGFAHGFCTLTDESEVYYKVDSCHRREHEGGLLWNDPEMAIPWPKLTPTLSERDRVNPTLQQFRRQHGGLCL
jgi:dTDP-4-dehydrorhamnose 3,5-epimerase